MKDLENMSTQKGLILDKATEIHSLQIAPLPGRNEHMQRIT